MIRKIEKKEVHKAIEGLLEGYEVIGPKELPSKGIFYQTITNTEDLYLGEGFTTEPIKKFFLRPSEWLFEERFEDGSEILEDTSLSEKRRIIMGARPCEVRGLVLLDKVFDPSINSGSTLSGVERVDSDYKDSFYIHNRKRTIIVGLACLKPDRSCFCTSMGSSPVETMGMDVLLFNPEDRFTIEIITDKGKDIFGSLGEELNGGRKKSFEQDKEIRKNLFKTKIRVPEGLDEIFESDYWAKVSSPCISCGICTYLCPTCYCFDLIDEERKRLRCYDGCAFRDFTLQASGENPRPTKKERYRQRIFHKFDYFKKNFGENLCVGCGRCIRFCPVKIDIGEVVTNAPIS